MGILRDAIGSNRRPDPEAPTAVIPGPAQGAGAGGPADGAPPGLAPANPPLADQQSARASLKRRRDALAAQVTEMHWDLGGLVYEMAVRDHFRLDVVVRRAAMLQERDAELAEVERLLRMEEDGVAGACPTCAAPHSRGAMYCWQCGATLMERTPSAAVAATEPGQGMLDALLSGDAASEPRDRGDGAR